MENGVQIKTNDNHLIYGVLNSKGKNEKLIIFVHGLTGHKNEHQFYNAANFFPDKGFDTFRFDLYSGEKDGRNLTECTIETHSSDLNTVINYFKNNYNKICLVGHSLGGPTTLLAKTATVDSVVLWDPSFNIFEDLSCDMKFDERINKYILRWGTECILSPEMIESWKRLGDELIKHIIKPTKIICAGQAHLYKTWKQKIIEIKVERDFVIIEDAGHCFDEENTEKILFNETLKWFNR